MNHNLTTERSHLGVFSTTSYITIGDQYGKKSDADPRLQGKQFTADFPKAGIAGARPNNSLFEREHKWLYGGGEKCVPPHQQQQQQQHHHHHRATSGCGAAAFIRVAQTRRGRSHQLKLSRLCCCGGGRAQTARAHRSDA